MPVQRACDAESQAGNGAPNGPPRVQSNVDDLLRRGTKKQEPPGKLLGEFTPLFDRAAYCAMVERARHHIYEGDIFQIVLSNRLSAPFDLYQGDSKYRRGNRPRLSLFLPQHMQG